MVLFGNAQGLYAMHLAMFHRPHDVQAVLRIHLADPAADARLRRQLQRQPALWTLEPERFDLDRLAPASPAPLQRFGAQLFRAHFERGGHPELARQQVVVDAVLLFQPLDPAYHQQPALRYRLIGTGRQRFLLKRLDSRPDADLLLAVTVSARTPQTELQRDGQGWPTDPRHWSARLSAQQGAAWTVTHVLYADDADLH
ncbi:MAG: hypothetical protein GAK31_00297 [Stenotrophomonas maltophilia]|uniref:Uncharacterized protein n=1 Tax=Stenotrophomonas maltophilia TaxID=40324 RepID=A0A7V8JMX3_STEMA|nr:MAG: hypothetical protein GAK31_00297 [Stenotrophomonas maltophilia]